MNELEKSGLDILKRIGVRCFGDLGNVQIAEAVPGSSASPGESFEFDYFVLYEDKCLVGEMSGYVETSDLRKKYKRFRNHFDLLQLAATPSVFDHFSISPEDRHLFNEVRDFRAFFIAHEHEKFDIELTKTDNVAVIYRGDWDILRSYTEAIGEHALHPFLKLVGVTGSRDVGKDLRFEAANHSLMRMPSRVIAKGIDVRADVFTFVASPADLLDIAEVFRRELIPVVAAMQNDRYQRPLDFKKLSDMQQLVSDPNFMFPNSILIALDENCSYVQDRLTIPMVYGSLSVIDGQHRLFSYASPNLPDEARKHAQIFVTALKFQTSDQDVTLRCSARAFVEINQKQKRISSAHIDEIAYPVLGEEYPRALAAQVILHSNQSSGTPLHGLFSSSQTTKGVFKAATAIVYLASITNLRTIERLVSASSGTRAKHKEGYEKLFGIPIEEITQAEVVIKRGTMCLERYFRYVREVFYQDWPKRGELQETTLKYTKQ